MIKEIYDDMCKFFNIDEDVKKESTVDMFTHDELLEYICYQYGKICNREDELKEEQSARVELREMYLAQIIKTQKETKDLYSGKNI